MWGMVSVHELIGRIYMTQGRLDEAADSVRSGLTGINGLHLRGIEGALSLLSAELLIYKKDYQAAEQCLQNAASNISISMFHLFQLNLLHARIYGATNETRRALDSMRTALQLARTHHDGRWMKDHWSWAMPLLVNCHQDGILRDYIDTLFLEAGPQVRDALQSIKKSGASRLRRSAIGLLEGLRSPEPPPLSIRCLGKFEVAVGDRVIPAESWRNMKALMLFKFMVLKFNHGFIPKEVLVELAWPDADADKTRLRFHVAMTYLRKLLEPALARGNSSAYILRRNDAYRLNIGQSGHIDFITFMTELSFQGSSGEEGDDAKLCRYLKAERMYTGALFAEDLYADWAAADREILAAKYLKLVPVIIGLYEAQSDWRKCIEYAEKYLAVEAGEEKVYAALMRYCHYAGERTRIDQVFTRCKREVSEHLDCPLDETTISLYRTLTGKTPS